ncbi:hypothetical protein SAMN06265371_101199 [Lutibacter agarilyticus]|uniref:von Willebrand factor type A domain-containing protein n=1 Tax=Lutibacter agarilyticus TaxID=1109740 RepID=A0A238VCB4_9FLAO|nr:VWA domain-containing protein [Lutibacter agarilyticus]SNR31896.1 hypothetical protein SAMN06265371_101199 [Lutibacter agarilyticus]
METATLLYLILATIAALLLAAFQYLYKSKEKSQLNYWLSFLRFLTFFSIFILLINPSIKKRVVEIVKPNLLVAVDNSASINYNKQTTTVTKVLDVFKSNSALNSKYEVAYYSFGKEVQLADSLAFNETETNISKLLQNFSKIYKEGINPVVLITDGNSTSGNSIEFSTYKSPVYPLVIGDTSVIEDIYISQLNANKYSFINNQFPVELFVNYTGKKAVSKKLSIIHKGKIIHKEVLNFSETENSQISNFYLTANNGGVQYYTAAIENLKNEQNTINNSKTFSVDIIEEKSEIAIVTSVIHPDLGMFKKSIESNKQRTVNIYNINDSELELSDYQLVILYQPTKKFKNLFTEVKDKEINYFIVSGTSTDWGFLNTAQPFFKKESSNVTEHYLPEFNPNYASFINTDIGFESFSPLNNEFGELVFSIPYQTLLYKKIGAITTEQPLLVTFENDAQKIGLFVGEYSWRWRMSSFTATKSFEAFDGFISNLMQYLTSNLKNKRLNSSVKSLFYANETIQVTANYFDKNLNLDTRAKLWLTIINEENNYIHKIPFAITNNRFVAELSNIPPEEYSYTVTVENQSERVSGNFKVLPFDVEQQFSQSNDRGLKILSEKTSGKTFYSDETADLIQTLVNAEASKSIQKATIIKTPLIDWKWLLGFILFLLSFEWFTRKYFGKI